MFPFLCPEHVSMPDAQSMLLNFPGTCFAGDGKTVCGQCIMSHKTGSLKWLHKGNALCIMHKNYNREAIFML
ncbi:MAG: hypothetical protein AMJ61_09000 [Desulfobacterales bacterium SG8_35_2]|nr:MAG: hypothetical protein AMJ61_09000 [Desulfobacterales bacterium SG8_35_2]